MAKWQSGILTSVVHLPLPGTVGLLHHVHQLGALHVLPEPAHDSAELLGCDDARLSFIKYSVLRNYNDFLLRPSLVTLHSPERFDEIVQCDLVLELLGNHSQELVEFQSIVHLKWVIQ